MFNLPMEASVVSNLAPKHYGILALRHKIDPVKDAGVERFRQTQSGRWGVAVMTWYIHQGDDLMRVPPIEFDFYTELPVNASHDLLQVQSVLQECELAQAPRHAREGIVKPNCTLKTDLSVIATDHFFKNANADNEWWDLHY